MFSYERHMVIALAIAVIAIVTVVSIVVLGIPLPFLDK
jgi:ABC-type enterochelin transport system permease subunit